MDEDPKQVAAALELVAGENGILETFTEKSGGGIGFDEDSFNVTLQAYDPLTPQAAGSSAEIVQRMALEAAQKYVNEQLPDGVAIAEVKPFENGLQLSVPTEALCYLQNGETIGAEVLSSCMLSWVEKPDTKHFEEASTPPPPPFAIAAAADRSQEASLV